MAATKRYQLTDGDKAIFAKAHQNPNYFTDYYLRGEHTGTYWRPVSEHSDIPEIQDVIDRWDAGYKTLVDIWQRGGNPDRFAYHGRTYRTTWVGDPDPVFHDHHGMILLDWQLRYWQAKQPTKVVIGGYGCIAGETRIYDAALNAEITVEDLYKQKRAPTVLAWTGTRFVPIQASLPFIKGKQSLYRITLESGRTITTTQDHVFLTEQGWKRLDELSISARLVVSAQDPLASNWESDPSAFLEDAQRYSQRVVSSQCDYPGCSHSGDVPLPPGADTFPEIAPSPIDVLEHSLNGWYRDDPALACTDSRDRSESLPARSHSLRRLARPAEGQVESGCCDKSAVPVPYLASDQARPQSLQYLVPHLLRESGCIPYRDPARTDVSGVVPDPGWSYCQCEHEWHSDLSDLSQDDAPLLSMCHAHSADDPVLHWSYPGNSGQPSAISFVEPSYYIAYDSIAEIEFVREDIYYDLHVPVWQNYLAEGIVNHNSAKTLGWLLSALIRAATLPGYRAFALAPYSVQAMEVYTQAMILLEGSVFAERFLIGHTTKPYPKLTISNDRVGESTIECYSIMDDPEKILTLSGDEAMVDQAEKLDDIDALIRIIGSRFRGTVRGRERLNYISFMANSADNPQLWDLAEEAETDPEGIWFDQPETTDNPYITPKQLITIAKRVGGDAQSRAVHLKGQRPIGSGEHFPASSIQKMRADWLDQKMVEMVAQENVEWVRVEVKKAQVVKWEAPPEDNAEYLVIADPGYDNPPNRNSAAIGVWDISNFPVRPAYMRAFTWVYGNGSPDPWLEQFLGYVWRYKAIGRCGYDGTGPQKGYDRWIAGLQTVQAEPMDMGGTKKFVYLNTAKMMASRGLLQTPDIPLLFSQLSKYRLPDDKMRQDLVMMFCLSAGWLERLYYESENREQPNLEKKTDRYERAQERERSYSR